MFKQVYITIVSFQVQTLALFSLGGRSTHRESARIVQFLHWRVLLRLGAVPSLVLFTLSSPADVTV